MEHAITVLGIETSCDETAAAVVELRQDRLRVRSSIVGSQVEVHAPYGGVVPELASRAHLERILPVIRSAVATAGTAGAVDAPGTSGAVDAPGTSCAADARFTGIDAIAVGVRPGLIGSLLVGTSAGKALAWSLGVPFLGVDHVAAHLVAAMLDADAVPFPALGLVVSGGHTAVFRMEDATTISLLSRTPDDAVGEAFDKGATVLGLPYPGGPEIERSAATGRETAVDFPIPRVDFSFSGLKTALLHEVRGVPGRHDSVRSDRAAVERLATPSAPEGATADAASRAGAIDDSRRADLAASYQRALVRALLRGLSHAWDRAMDEGESPKALVVGGGVAANTRLRAELASFAAERRVPLHLPPLAYCVDNAAMIAGLGALRAARGERDPLDLAPQPISSIRS